VPPTNTLLPAEGGVWNVLPPAPLLVFYLFFFFWGGGGGGLAN